MAIYALLLTALLLAGCTGSLGVGGEDGVGVRSSVGIDGKILEIAPTDGDGDAQAFTD
jgi:hypothetical protein